MQCYEISKSGPVHMLWQQCDWHCCMLASHVALVMAELGEPCGRNVLCVSSPCCYGWMESNNDLCPFPHDFCISNWYAVWYTEIFDFIFVSSSFVKGTSSQQEWGRQGLLQLDCLLHTTESSLHFVSFICSGTGKIVICSGCLCRKAVYFVLLVRSHFENPGYSSGICLPVGKAEVRAWMCCVWLGFLSINPKGLSLLLL